MREKVREIGTPMPRPILRLSQPGLQAHADMPGALRKVLAQEPRTFLMRVQLHYHYATTRTQMS